MICVTCKDEIKSGSPNVATAWDNFAICEKCISNIVMEKEQDHTSVIATYSELLGIERQLISSLKQLWRIMKLNKEIVNLDKLPHGTVDLL